ncbi:MAG: twin-arginine translocation signal domain-containing protein, partial [Planctomycetaceae bacterium]
MTTRRTFLKSSALGSGSLALSPSFNHLLGAPNLDLRPQRFIFIRKSNGNIPSLFSLPTFSEEEKKKEEKKEAFEADLDKHELPQWLRAMEGHKESMTILNGISMNMSDGGHYSF